MDIDKAIADKNICYIERYLEECNRCIFDKNLYYAAELKLKCLAKIELAKENKDD